MKNVYITESLCCIAKINQLYFDKIKFKKEWDWLYSPSSLFSLDSWAGWPGTLSCPHTHEDVPVVCQAKHWSGKHGDVYLYVLSLF